MKTITWVDKLSKPQQLKAYREWQEAKKDIDEPADLTFTEWKTMEREIAKSLERPKKKRGLIPW